MEAISIKGLFRSKEPEIFSIRDQLEEDPAVIPESDQDGVIDHEDLTDAASSIIRLIRGLSDSLDRCNAAILTVEENINNFSTDFDLTISSHSELSDKQDEVIKRLENKITAFQQDRKINIKEKKAFFKKVRKLYMLKVRCEKWVAAQCSRLETIRTRQENSAFRFEKYIVKLVKKKTNLQEFISSHDKNNETPHNKTSVNGVHRKIAAYKKVCIKLEKYFSRYRQTISDTADKINAVRSRLIKKINRIKKRLLKMTSENTRLKNELSEYITAKEQSLIENEDKKLSAQVEQYRKKHAELHERIAELETENASFKTQLSEQRQNEESAENNNPVMKTLYRENKELTGKIEEYRAKIESMRIELEELIASRQEHMDPDCKENAEKKPDHSQQHTAHGTDEQAPAAETLYNIFLPKLTSQEKKEKAVPLIAEIKGVSEEEAASLANRIVIPIIKGVNREQAEKIKKRFIDKSILPRIKQQM